MDHAPFEGHLIYSDPQGLRVSNLKVWPLVTQRAIILGGKAVLHGLMGPTMGQRCGSPNFTDPQSKPMFRPMSRHNKSKEGGPATNERRPEKEPGPEWTLIKAFGFETSCFG